MQAVNYVLNTGWETAALTSMARGFFPSQSPSIAGTMRVQGPVDQPCLVSWLRAPCHEALLPCLPKAMSAPCRANAIHRVMIVACLLSTITRNPNTRYYQHTAERCLKFVYVPTVSRSAGQNCSLVSNSAFEKLSGIRLPGQSTDACWGTSALLFLGVPQSGSLTLFSKKKGCGIV